MTKIVNPFAHRLGIIKDWRSKWFSKIHNFSKNLKVDVVIREYLKKKLRGMYIDEILLERNAQSLKISILTSRPGVVIGKNGEGISKLKKELLKEIKRRQLVITEELVINVEEVRSPEKSAQIIAQTVADGLEKRMPFRRVLKQTVEKVMANREVKGVKIALSGRLAGADMARREYTKKGQIPLQTFRSDISFCRYEAKTPFVIGIKVWIYRGEVFKK